MARRKANVYAGAIYFAERFFTAIGEGGMMEDRELLELAANAAGYKWRKDIAEYRDGTGILGLWLINDDGAPLHTGWNPLDDDGAALRLAVKLELDIYGQGSTRFAESDIGVAQEEGDPYSATRRAIVRAAASIGKKDGES